MRSKAPTRPVGSRIHHGAVLFHLGAPAREDAAGDTPTAAHAARKTKLSRCVWTWVTSAAQACGLCVGRGMGRLEAGAGSLSQTFSRENLSGRRALVVVELEEGQRGLVCRRGRRLCAPARALRARRGWAGRS